MNIKILKPNVLKAFIFLLIMVVFLYLAVESTCGASLFFTFCYKAYGFPFYYLITGDVDAASDYANSMFLNEYFTKSQDFLLNPASLILDVALMYILACFISTLFEKKSKNLKI